MITQAKLVTYLIVGGLLILLVWWGSSKVANHFAEFKELQQYKQTSEQIGQGTTGAIGVVGGKVGEVQAVEIVITDQRSSAERQFEELKNEDQTVGAWADGRIPDRVRESERERRAALDRPSDAEAGGEGAGTGKTR